MNLAYGGGAIADYPWHLDGSRPWSDSDRDSAMACLSMLKFLGIEWIDTANRYGNGISEILIGEFLKNSTDDYKIITKIELNDIYEMEKEYKISLSRLGQIDCLLLHNPDLSRRSELEDACRWMVDTDIQFVGFSTEPSRDARIYYEKHDLNAIEFPYSYWDLRADSEIFPWIGKDDLKICNRVLGGPSKELKDSSNIYLATCFLKKIGDVDLAIIGTTYKNHLIEISKGIE